jgi:transcriptional regulator with XRE-family HTH domain
MTTINKNLSRVLSEARARTGLGQAEFAARFGLKQQTYNNYEKGRVPKKRMALTALADGLKMSVDDLLGLNAPYNNNNDGRGDIVVNEQSDIRFALADRNWKLASTEKLEAILEACIEDRDYGAVAKVADELLNRKIQERMK